MACLLSSRHRFVVFRVHVPLRLRQYTRGAHGCHPFPRPWSGSNRGESLCCYPSITVAIPRLRSAASPIRQRPEC